VVVCDTTALMTAVYSHTVFGDDSLDASALQAHRRVSLTLLTALDLPWVADGLQRDGPQVREPVDDRLRQLLARGAVAWSLVSVRCASKRRWRRAAPALQAPRPASPAARGVKT
jgi:nicotinamide riboside kinase